MKKSIYYIIPVLAFILFANTFGQKPVIELTFTAVNNSQNVPLDSIYIENLTQGGDTTLYGADTILSLEYNVGIFDNYSFNENSLSVSQNYPNPFTDQTKINIYLPEKEYIKITVRDILGRELAQYENRFNRGNHSFIFYSGNEKYYLFTVTGKQTSKTIKMLIANGNTTNVRKCKIVYNDYEENVIGFKSQKAVNDFIFYLGDELLLVGYSDLGESVLIDSPSATQIYSFQFATNIPCPGTPTVTYEGQVYNTIQIFSQCWLKENLNVGTMINGSQNQSNNSTIEKYCYDNDPANCNTYGGQYQWDEMMQYQTTQGVQGICPPDWHLPTDEEWKQLEGAVDSQYGYPDPGWDGAGGWRGFDAGLNLKSTNGWYSGGNGADLYGFNALPGGYRYFGGDFMELGLYGPFWASTEFDSYAAWYRSLSSSSDKVYRNEYPNACGISVRCLKDDTITSIPSVTTGIVLNITINSADIEGEITDLGGSDVTQHGHCWSTNPNPTINDYKTELG
jgi:uncharacterized protein (TIGR02145 family)